jgi:hypothetical protein
MELSFARGKLQDPDDLRLTWVDHLAGETNSSNIRSIHETQRQPGEYHANKPEDPQNTMGGLLAPSVAGPEDHRVARNFPLGALFARKDVGPLQPCRSPVRDQA